MAEFYAFFISIRYEILSNNTKRFGTGFVVRIFGKIVYIEDFQQIATL